MTRTAHHNGTEHTHPVYWCDDCKRTHNGTHDDARAILGDRGTWAGFAYVWHNDAYLYGYAGATTPIWRHKMSRAFRSRQLASGPVRVIVGGADAFIDAYNVARTYPHHTVRRTITDDVSALSLARLH